MCMNVDFPEPEGPMTATNSPRFDRQRHAVDRVNDLVAHRVVFAQVDRADDRRAQWTARAAPPLCDDWPKAGDAAFALAFAWGPVLSAVTTASLVLSAPVAGLTATCVADVKTICTGTTTSTPERTTKMRPVEPDGRAVAPAPIVAPNREPAAMPGLVEPGLADLAAGSEMILRRDRGRRLPFQRLQRDDQCAGDALGLHECVGGHPGPQQSGFVVDDRRRSS